jgi:hypothetical protein
MPLPELQNGELVLAHANAQLAKGFPQTAGDLVLTDRRLVLVPNQLASLWFGKRWEIALARIAGIEKLERFKGGTWIGSAGRKLVIRLDNASEHIFSFYLTSNLDGFYEVLQRQLREHLVQNK